MHEKIKATNNSPGGAGGTQGRIGAYALEEDAVVEDAANRNKFYFKTGSLLKPSNHFVFSCSNVFPFPTLLLQCNKSLGLLSPSVV